MISVFNNKKEGVPKVVIRMDSPPWKGGVAFRPGWLMYT